MEAQIKVGGSVVPIRCTAGTLFLYREFFGHEFIDDLNGDDDINTSFKFMWACAKTADPAFIPPEIWAKRVAGNDLTAPIAGTMALLQRSIELDGTNDDADGDTDSDADEWSSARMISQGLMIGLSYADMCQMSIGLLISTVRSYCKLRCKDADEPKVRKATQADFDKF